MEIEHDHNPWNKSRIIGQKRPVHFELTKGTREAVTHQKTLYNSLALPYIVTSSQGQRHSVESPNNQHLPLPLFASDILSTALSDILSIMFLLTLLVFELSELIVSINDVLQLLLHDYIY